MLCSWASASEVSADDISLALELVTPQIGVEKSQAIVGIRISNESAHSVQVPLSTIAGGKGAASIDYGKDRPAFDLTVGDRRQPFAGCAAKVDYQWLNEANVVTLAGTSFLTAEMLKLPPVGTQLVTLPIGMPTTPGRYSLSLTINNKLTALTSLGSNSRLIYYHEEGFPVFFEKNLSASVLISARPKS